jgi:YD repeat-containing protein
LFCLSGTQTRTFTYDNTTQRLVSVGTALEWHRHSTYNADGTVATKVDAKNQKIAHTYDSYKQVTQIQRYPVSTGAETVCQRVFQTFPRSTSVCRFQFTN